MSRIRTTGRVAAALLLLMSPTAWANYFCYGSVDQVQVSADGGVVLHTTMGLSFVRLCSVAAAENGFAAEACKGILAILLRAQATGATVEWEFSDGLSCSSHPTWAELTGVVWGPNIQSP